MTKVFEEHAAKITKAQEHLDKAKKAYVDASAEFDGLTQAMAELTGYPPDDSLKGLIRNWVPKIATFVGLPGAAALLTGLTADAGAFSGILSAIGIGG